MELAADADSEDLTGWLAKLTEPDVADSVLMGILLPTEWVHRRVETVSILDMRRIRRRVSIDFTMGFATPSLGVLADGCRLVGLAMLKKRVLNSLDVVAADGRSLPVLTTRQNAALAGAVLKGAAGALIAAPLDWLEEALDAIAASPAPRAAELAQQLRQRLTELPAADPLRRLLTLPAFDDLVNQFAHNFILAAVVPGDGGCRAIVKVTYEEPTTLVAEDLSRWNRLLQSLGLSPREFAIDIPAAMNTESFHLEVCTPQGISICGAAMFEVGVDGAVNEPEVLRGLETQGTPRAGVDQVHFHASQSCTSAAQVYVWLRIARGGWLRSAVLVTAVVLAISIANATRLSAILRSPDESRPSTDIAALLMAVVGLLASVAVRVGEHPMTVKTVATLRYLTLLAVSVPLVQGWSLAFGPRGDGLLQLWWWLAAAGLAMFVAVLAAYVGPRSVTPNAYDADL